MAERASVVQLLFGMGISRDVVASVLTCVSDASAADHDAVSQTLAEVRDDLEAQIDEFTDTRRRVTEFLERRTH